MSKFLNCIMVLLIVASSTAYAVNRVVCKPITLKTESNDIVLPGVDQPHTTQVYFLKNNSQQSIWIDHPVENRAASAGWSSYLQPGQWSAILLNRKDFELNCAVIKPGNVEYQNCAKTMTVCTPQQFVINSKRKGSYWLIENQAWDDLLKSLEKRSIKNG